MYQGICIRSQYSWPSNSHCRENRSAGHVEDRVGFVRALLQCRDSFGRRKHEQFDLEARGFSLYLIHHWQRAGSGADHQPSAFPRYLLLDGQGCVPESVAELLGYFLLALANLPAIDQHVVFVGDAINADRTKNPRWYGRSSEGEARSC